MIIHLHLLHLVALPLVLSTLFTNPNSHGVLAQDYIIERDFLSVTYGSVIKLAHLDSSYYLHSHDVPYGSGSGQQSVTAYSKGDDPNSYWVVTDAYAAGAGPTPAFHPNRTRGSPVECNAVIRLRHVNTKAFLHSHLHAAPLTPGNQEVSCFSGLGVEDNWMVECERSSAKMWEREMSVRLHHRSTSKYLSASKRHVYNHPISGQLEVRATDKTGKEESWAAIEGLYFSRAADMASDL